MVLMINTVDCVCLFYIVMGLCLVTKLLKTENKTRFYLNLFFFLYDCMFVKLVGTAVY